MPDRVDRERRAVLRGIATLTGSAVASGSGSGANGSRSPSTQQVDPRLSPGVTLFDLNGDGAYAATVERAAAEMRDESHPAPIHVTSGGQSTVDYAISAVEPPAGTTLGGLGELTYDYYEGPNDSTSGASDGGVAPDETFLVVENADGRHGTYLTYDDDAVDRTGGQWWTFDVLARMTGDTAGTSRWYEYTAVEEGYDAQTFDDAIDRFGADARLLRVGVGHGDAVTPATLDLFYAALVIDGETRQFPVSVVERVSGGALF